MTTSVRQIQVVQGEIAANKLLAEGWVYLQSVVIGQNVSHVLGTGDAVDMQEKKPVIYREAVSTRTMRLH